MAACAVAHVRDDHDLAFGVAADLAEKGQIAQYRVALVRVELANEGVLVVAPAASPEGLVMMIMMVVMVVVMIHRCLVHRSVLLMVMVLLHRGAAVLAANHCGGSVRATSGLLVAAPCRRLRVVCRLGHPLDLQVGRVCGLLAALTALVAVGADRGHPLTRLVRRVIGGQVFGRAQVLGALGHSRITALQADYTALFDRFCAFLRCCDLLLLRLLLWLLFLLLVFGYGLLVLGVVMLLLDDFGGRFVGEAPRRGWRSGLACLGMGGARPRSTNI